MITIIAITYIFYLMWYFISSWKLLSENPQDTPTPPKNIHSLIFTQSPWNIQKVQVPSFWQHWIFFRPAAERREDTRIDRSVLRKITIDLLHCWDVYDVNLLEKILTEVRLIHAEKISLCNFIILRKKRGFNIGVFLWNSWNIQEQRWLLLKISNILLRNKKLHRV